MADKYKIINIRRYIGNDNPELGEDALFQILSEFSCPMNPDVERFLKKSSIEFTKKNQSVTYLVFSVIGGMVAFLEAENKEKLLSFYRNNRFFPHTRQISMFLSLPL